MRKFYVFMVTFSCALFFMPQISDAIPAFARKYGFNCNMCHTSFTKLNDYGQRYRNDGYQIPGQEGGEKNVFEIAPPLSFRITAGFSAAESDKRTTSGFDIYTFDLLSAGVMHKNVSYLLIYTPRVDEPAGEFQGGTNRPMQLGTLESANIIFSNLIQDALFLRLGRMEPVYHPVSNKRSYYILQQYEIYKFQTPGNNFSFGANQTGIEATGWFETATHYGLGVVNGSGAFPDNNKFKDVYANLYQIFGKGEGQSAGQRIGVFGYLGWSPTVLPGSIISPWGETNGRGNKKFNRFGGDISLNYATFNLRGMFLYGVDNKDLNVRDFAKDYKYNGGFAELDYAGLINNRFLISAMYNWIKPPKEDEENKITAISGVVRYYLGDWTAVNVALHAEVTHREIGKTTKIKENLMGAMVDFDF